MAGRATALDLLVSSGGVSGGDADHVAAAIRKSGGHCRTLKLAMRRGKPIGFGRIDRTHVLALPGNPVAALVNFLLFGRPLIRRLAGADDADPPAMTALTASIFAHAAGRSEFISARISGISAEGLPLVEKLGRGGSARLLALVAADGLVEIGPDREDVPSGTSVRFHPFATSFAL